MNLLVWLAIAVWFSWAIAKERGVPWFRFGGTKPQPNRWSSRLRTESIKPQSPWLKGKEQPTAQKPAQRKSPQTRVVRLQHPDISRLNALVHNEELSQRLVERLKEKNPHRDYGWCIEKAIYDIERDRMAR